MCYVALSSVLRSLCTRNFYLAPLVYLIHCSSFFLIHTIGCDFMVHYGHSCLIPVDQTSGIKMLYVFVDIKLDTLHFIETLNLNFSSGKKLIIACRSCNIPHFTTAAEALQKNLTYHNLYYRCSKTKIGVSEHYSVCSLTSIGSDRIKE